MCVRMDMTDLCGAEISVVIHTLVVKIFISGLGVEK